MLAIPGGNLSQLSVAARENDHSLLVAVIRLQQVVKEDGSPDQQEENRNHECGPRSRSTLAPVIPLSRFSLVSRAREFPNPHLDLGKPVGEADSAPRVISQLTV